MFEKYIETLNSAISEYGDFHSSETDDSVCFEGELKAGTKGMTVKIECTPRLIKIKGTREYGYEVKEEAADIFQGNIQEKYPECSCYVSGQNLTFSKFASCDNPEDAASIAIETLAGMSYAVSQFESKCVNFDSTTEEEKEEEEYDPEDNVDLFQVDNSSHAAPTTAVDNEEYLARNRAFTEKVFSQLCGSLPGTRNGNEFVSTVNDRTTKLMLFPLDGEIMISVSVQVEKSTGAMYSTYIRANYPEVLCGYENGEFSVKSFSTPDEYAPDETKGFLDLCTKAMDACVKEYSQVLEKKDVAGFASDVQEVLSEQAKSVSEREKAVSAREEEISAREEELKARTEELEEQLKTLEEEKVAMAKEIEEERERIKNREAEMEEEKKKYQDQNTKDILRIEQLAKQISTLQDRQAALGQGNAADEAEMFRLKSRVTQLISQKAALEKTLNDKIISRDSKIRDLNDAISMKDKEIQKMEASIDDLAKSRAAEETQKSEEELADLRKRLASIGHILTAAEVSKHFKRYEELNVRRFHASDGSQFIVFKDESLDIRIRIGDMNYVDVSKVAPLKDNILRRLNSGNDGIKFFSTEDKKIVARAYFSKTATADDVEGLVDEISNFFSK